MKNKKIILMMALALTVAFSALGQDYNLVRNQAGKKNFQREWMGKPGQCDLQFENGLTKEQREVIQEIRLNAAKEAKPLKFKLKELKARYQTLINEDKADMKAISANIDEISKVKTQLAKIKAKAHVEVLAKLTDEQKLLFSERKNGKMGKRSFRGRMVNPELL